MYNQVASKHGTTQATGLLLLAVKKEGTPSTSIATSLGMEATSMSRIIKKLEEKNLIYRKKDKDDKRIVRIFLTSEGVAKRRVAKKVMDEFNALVEEEIPQSKLSVFIEVLDSINATMEKYKEQNGL
jgi:DNA-binding MarR family transcriptional regulator